MSVLTAANLKKIGCSEWVHPSTGEVRIYINDLPELYGLRTSHYKTGNISSATLDGNTISNSEAGRILSRLRGAKLWLGADGQLMKKGLDDADCRAIVAALTTKIEAALAAEVPAEEPAASVEFLTVEGIRQFEVDAAGFTDVVELARHIAPVFDAQYAGVQMTTGGGLLRSEAACAIDATIERVCDEAGYPNVVDAYSLAVQMLARRGLPVFGQQEEPGFVRDAVAAAGVDAYTQNEYKHRRARAANPDKFGASVAKDAAAQVQVMHDRFPVLRALDAYLTTNGR